MPSNSAPIPLPDNSSADDRAVVARTLAKLSAAWRNRRYDELAALLDERIVMALPGFAGRVEGRDALVDGYRDFMERATLTRYEEQPPTIDIWGRTAIASYRWEMEWSAGGESQRAAGYDVFVFRRSEESGDAEAWRAVWRTMAFDGPPPES
jgi:hypothetical protein